MENLEDLWENLKLTEEKDQVIEITKEEVEDIRRMGELCLVGKVWTEGVISKSVIEIAMNRIWHLSAKMDFQEVGSNIFLISFANIEGKV